MAFGLLYDFLMGQSINRKFKKVYATIINRNPETYSNQITLNVGSNDEVFKKAFYQKYGKKLEQMSATAYAQLSLMLNILKHNDVSVKEIIEKNDSIFGKLILDNRSIRYMPIVEVVE